MNSIMHLDTPSLAVSDSRGLPVRSVQFYRAFDGQRIEARVTQQYFDMAGRPIASRDPRFFSRLKHDAHAPVNLKQTVSLSGAVLLSESVDAGWQLSLNGQAGHLLESHDGRGTQRHIEYDALLRPLSINESGRTAERFSYGGPAAAERNQCNQLIRHDDTAGARFLPDYGVLGAALTECRQFLQAHDAPDWPLAERDRDALLETEASTTRTAFNALGETTRQTDAANNVQVFGQTVSGQLKTVELTLAGAAQPQTLVSAIDYSASGQVVQETAGNGATSVYHYDLQDDRLVELGTTLTSGRVLQRLHYTYDPVGNVVKIEDRAQAITHCNNQSTAPINGYAYDTLYQLINATGREVRSNTGHGPALPDLQPLPLDPNRLAHYEQSYYYDAGGNLLTLCHDGAQSFTRHMRVAPNSNRSLPEDEFNTGLPESFDASGNLLDLVRGQPLRWDVRNQLQQITFIRRADGPNDDECYSYDGQGQRCRKISTSQASGRTLTHEVRYLPGLEIRTTAGDETLHVITAQAGRNSVRVLHWEAGKPGAIANDQVRYSLSDHLGSSTLELDQQGALISHERYYPFGGTAWWAARSAVEAKYKTVRYSGKERDASGLYYYGFRYYAPWLQRWINPDPAGAVDGLNLYRMVGNNPLRNKDNNGLQYRSYQGFNDDYEQNVRALGLTIVARGRESIKQLKKPPVDKLGHALDVVDIAYKESHAVFNGGVLTDTQQAIVWNVMGETSLARLPEMASQYSRLSDAVQRYSTGSGFNQFAVFGRNPDRHGLTHKEDPHKKVFLGREVLEFHTLGTALVVGHEISHTTPDHSRDYVYMNANFTRDEGVEQLSTEGVLESLQGMIESASRVTQGYRDQEIFLNIDSMIKEKKLTAAKVMEIFDTKSVQDISIHRLNHPGVRDKLLRNNADTVIFLGLFLGQDRITSRMKALNYVT
ncbi:YD repeat protein [Pseudomonas syringae]|uniref:RHS repeat domain-containing protein n=1 Tax=Pseudomonas syringae TaxID=317 RepID=UPI001CA8744F|nr:RHS repeat-associated core domain-containing protein [Pseudomonas syringae]MCI3946920.1 YD repeat protein [Pseudomonas syringae]